VNWDAIIIGGGPAGMMAAGTAAARGRRVVLLERNEKLGKKLFLTGKGRCNLTNAAEIEEFIPKTVRNGKFLYSAFYAFTNQDLMDFFTERGLPLKVERGGRVFPESDRSSDVTRVFERYLERGKAGLRLNTRVGSFMVLPDGTKEVKTRDGEQFHAAHVLIATGGASYPSTGSTGDGYELARRRGHTIVEPEPSLVPLVVEEEWAGAMGRLSLRNVALSAYADGKQFFSEQGEVMFIKSGVSGPLPMTLSALIGKHMKKGKRIELSVDLKPALSDDVLDKRLRRDFEKYGKRHFRYALDDLLPKQMIPIMVRLSGIPDEKKVSELTREERAAFRGLLKDLRLTVKGKGTFPEAIITSGGVSTKEIDPSTMQSKLVEGLFFAGEVIDVDALTGGFNMQIAFSTGHLAGEHI
jgi:predicted Rossmann fold flavoprotein